MSHPLWQYLHMMMNDNNKMNKEQFKNEVLALVSEDALPMVDALTEQGFAEGWTPAEVAGQCEADVQGHS